MGIGNVTAALLLAAGYPVLVSIAGALAFGAGIGLINGLLVTKGRMEPIIATLATMIGARSVIYFMTSGTPIFQGIPPEFMTMSQGVHRGRSERRSLSGAGVPGGLHRVDTIPGSAVISMRWAAPRRPPSCSE
jgi:ribose/xylose/arabinose/galactoside ABC-type transport system permease subunit